MRLLRIFFLPFLLQVFSSFSSRRSGGLLSKVSLAEANRPDGKPELMGDVAIVEHREIAQRHQGEVASGEKEDGIHDRRFIVQLKEAQRG